MKRRISRRRQIRRRVKHHETYVGQMTTSNEPTQSFDESQPINPETILQLQQTHGNQYVSRMIQRAEPDDTPDRYTQSEINSDHYALAEAVEMLRAIDRGAELGMDYYRSKTIPNYIGRKIWYAAQKDVSASQRLHHLQSAYQQFQPIIKRYSRKSSFLPSQFRIYATKSRVKLEKKAADEKIINRENELQDSSYGLGTLSEDKMRLQLIATVKTADGVFKQVKEVSDKVLSVVDKGLAVGKDMAETESNPMESLAKKHLAGEDVAAETKAVVNAQAAKDMTDKADDTPNPKADGQKTAKNIGDVMVALKGIGYALQIADVVKRENALKEILDKFPHPVATTTNVAGKVFEVMQYGMDVSEVVLRRVAQAKGGEALKQVAGSLEMLGKASKALGGASSALFLIRDITVLLDDDSTEKQKSEATFSAATNTASLGLLIAGAKGASYANPLAVSLFLTQVMLEQTGEHIFWKSNQTLISEFSKDLFKHIDDKALYLPLSSSSLKATNEVMLSGKEEGADGQDIDPWEEDMIDSHVGEDDVRSRLKHLDLRMRNFIDVVLNPNSDNVPVNFPSQKPAFYGVIREYFEEFDYLQSTIDFDSLQGEELQDMVDDHLQSATDLIKTYRMFRMQKGDIAKVLGTRYEGDRNALADDVMKNKDKLSEVFA